MSVLCARRVRGSAGQGVSSLYGFIRRRGVRFGVKFRFFLGVHVGQVSVVGFFFRGLAVEVRGVGVRGGFRQRRLAGQQGTGFGLSPTVGVDCRPALSRILAVLSILGGVWGVEGVNCACRRAACASLRVLGAVCISGASRSAVKRRRKERHPRPAGGASGRGDTGESRYKTTGQSA